MKKQAYAIDYGEAVALGGVKQYIRVRGTDKANPVLLFLHGGPGVCDRHWVLECQSGLADICTLVCWDQRGSGKSFRGSGASGTLTIETMVSAASELVDYLCDKLGKEQVYIVGHSWGSVLGVLLAQRRPERIAAYVGMGQVVDLEENERLSYKFVLDEANNRGDKKAIKKLAKIGEPKNGSYGPLKNLIAQRGFMSKYGGAAYGHSENIFSSLVFPILRSPEYTLPDLLRYARGSFYSLGQLWSEVTETIRFNQTAKKLDVPVYITQGRHDWNTPSEIAEQWFNELSAPCKELIWFEHSAHSPIKEEPELWGRVIREKVFTANVGAG